MNIILKTDEIDLLVEELTREPGATEDISLALEDTVIGQMNPRHCILLALGIRIGAELAQRRILEELQNSCPTISLSSL